MSKKQGNVTLANVISIVGFVALAFLFYCGHSLMNPNENIGVNIIVSVGATLLVAFILWLMVHAKEVEDSFKGWLVVEILAALAFVGTACWTGYEMMHFFVVSDKVDNLKGDAESDLENIRKEISSFIAQEGARLDVTCLGLKDAVSSNRYDEHVKEYMSDNDIVDINKWKEMKSDEISLVEYDGAAYKRTWDSRMNEISGVIGSWNLFFLPEAAGSISQLGEEVRTILTASSDALNLNVVNSRLNAEGKKFYTLGEEEVNTYGVKVNFPNRLKSASGFSFIGMIVIILVNLMILFNYIFAQRSKKARPSAKDGNSRGRKLYTDK